MSDILNWIFVIILGIAIIAFFDALMKFLLSFHYKNILKEKELELKERELKLKEAKQYSKN
jgi:hypothetical protein